jgi:hypothetical protein
VIGFFDAGFIREAFFLVVRFIAALAGFVVGYLLTGPIVTLLARVAFHKTLPNWSLAWFRVIGGLCVALLVFWLLPLGGGGGGGGGKGSGGGTGDGQGPGSGKTTGPGADGDRATGKTTGQAKPGSGQHKLVVEVLGPTTAKGDKYYRLYREEPAVDIDGVKSHLEKHRDSIRSMDIILTPQGASRTSQAVDLLFDLAKDNKLPEPNIITER